MERFNFESVKVNDKILIEMSGGYSSGREFYEGTVIKMTKTRFTVQYGNKYEITFNKEDGSRYPREQGFSRIYTHIKPLDEVGKSLIKRTQMVHKAMHLAGKLDDIFKNATYRNNIANMSMPDEEVDENIRLLEQTYERFKKYMKEQE